MAVRGIICLGLLDSTSDVLTLGLGLDVTVPPDTRGVGTIATLEPARAVAGIEPPYAVSSLTESRMIASLQAARTIAALSPARVIAKPLED